MRRDWQIMLLLAAATVAVFWQVSRHEFVNYDDPAYVTFNPMVQQGLTWPGVKWAFGQLHGEATYWHPLTWLSHMLDCQLYGLRPAGHHLTSLLLHTLNTVLLFALLRRMTGRRGPSAVVAALFALHPLQVDSVAWIAERKNLLSTFFLMLTLWAYARYVEGRMKGEPGHGCAARPSSAFCILPSYFFLFSLLMFALGLMCKPMLVTLPLVMLLLDYWPLRRLQLNTQHSKLKTLLPLFVEKLPFLALSAASSVVTIRAHESLGALVSAEELPLLFRLANAVVACALYLRKLVWPADLSVFYLHPGRWPAEAVAGSAVLWMGLTALAVWQWRRRPYLIVGWLWFLGMLLPVIGLVQAHVQALADRFAYVPAIGVFIMVVWALAEWAASWAKRSADTWKAPSAGWLPRYALPGLAALALVACVIVTSWQLRHWRNSITLLQHAVEVEPGNFLARVMLGNALFERRQLDRALREYQAAQWLKPDDVAVWVRIGVTLTELGRPVDAMPYLNAAMHAAPGWPEPRRRLALAFLRQGRRDDARAAYQQLVRLMPATAEAYRDLADMLAEGQQYPEAIRYYREALRLKPDFEAALNNLALLRATCPQPECRNGREAVQLAEAACRLSQRRNANLLGTLAAAYAEAGRLPQAIQTLQEAQACAKASGTSDLLSLQAQMLQQFRAGKPFRQPAAAAR